MSASLLNVLPKIGNPRFISEFREEAQIRFVSPIQEFIESVFMISSFISNIMNQYFQLIEKCMSKTESLRHKSSMSMFTLLSYFHYCLLHRGNDLLRVDDIHAENW